MTAFIPLALISIAAIGAGPAQPAQSPPPTTQANDDHPRMIVLVVVDQLRGDFIDRYHRHLGPDGFRRLTGDGAHFVNAYYSHGSTATGPGHACIITGSNPRVHGISANNDEHAESTDDESHPLIGLDDPARAAHGSSPARLLAPALGDLMKLSSGGQARVVSVGLKDRAVVLMGGKKADSAVWWDGKTGRFITSRYYAKTLPPYAEQLNRERFADQFFGRTWDRALPTDAYAACGADDEPAEHDNFGLGRTFPHAVTGGLRSPGRSFYLALWATPFGNDLVLELARRALDYEKLGSDDACDLLWIALSSFDVCGHAYGPDSHEMLDMMVRTDRQLAALWGWLDQKVGRDRYHVALTADHGVASISHVAKRYGIDAGEFSETAAVDALNAAVRRTFAVSDERVRAVAAIELPWLHLDHPVMQSAQFVSERVLEVCMAELRKMAGVGWVYSGSQLAGPLPPDPDSHLRMAWQAYHPQLAGEIYIGLRPYWHKFKPDDAAAHSTFHSYDRHVPILLYGPGVRAGRFYNEADPIDIARTLCAMIGVEPAPTMNGRVLSEALDTTPSKN